MVGTAAARARNPIRISAGVSGAGRVLFDTGMTPTHRLTDSSREFDVHVGKSLPAARVDEAIGRVEAQAKTGNREEVLRQVGEETRALLAADGAAVFWWDARNQLLLPVYRSDPSLEQRPIRP